MSDIRFNNWLHQSGTGGVHQDSAGNIGIGTSVPTTALDVVGVVSATTFSGNVIAPGNSTFSGSVGIGTDNPGGNILEVYKDQASNTSFSIKNPSTAAGTYASAYISAGSVNGQIYTDANGNAGLQGMTIQTTSNHGLRFNTNSTERLNITSGGNVQIANGNLVFSTAGTGIDFSATSNSSGTMTSELLDDYEEGTYSPAWQHATNVNYTAQNGQYIKIGRLVRVSGEFSFTTYTTFPYGWDQITLPFSGTRLNSAGSVSSDWWAVAGGGTGQVAGTLNFGPFGNPHNDTSLAFTNIFLTGNNGLGNAHLGNIFTSSSTVKTIRFHITYTATS